MRSGATYLALRAAAVVAYASFAWGCGERLPADASPFGDDRPRTVADLQSAQALWRSRGPSSYSFRLQRSCFCANREPVIVRVRGGRLAEVVLAESGVPVPADQLPQFKPVEGLFTDLQAAVDARVATVRARYDERLGFPADVFIDWSFEGADDEYGYVLDQFAP